MPDTDSLPRRSGERWSSSQGEEDIATLHVSNRHHTLHAQAEIRAAHLCEGGGYRRALVV
eukprot:3131196-Rhodomonas_salina.2